MPELPEVQVVKNFFDLQVVGKRISRVNIINNKLRYQIPPRLNSKLSNLIISEILRRGKYLILLFKNSDISLLIHLGMTGYFRLNSFFKPEKHDHIAFQLANEYLIFNDLQTCTNDDPKVRAYLDPFYMRYASTQRYMIDYSDFFALYC